ncbi:hypothetical protein ACN47E_008664 [Coniothyrium glycines]
MSLKNEQGGMDVKTKNVLNAPLHKHSSENTSPASLPPSLHAGYCTPTHPIAAQLTSSFLDLLARSTGTDLRRNGVSPGSRFCVAVEPWREAAAAGADVPRVKLECTHAAALERVPLDELRRFAARQDVEGRSAVVPGEGSGEGWVRESGEIGGKEPRA